MSTLTIVAPAIAPLPQATPGRMVDAPASTRPADVPRADVVVRLSEQVREMTAAEKRDTDERKQRLFGRELSEEQKKTRTQPAVARGSPGEKGGGVGGTGSLGPRTSLP